MVDIDTFFVGLKNFQTDVLLMPRTPLRKRPFQSGGRVKAPFWLPCDFKTYLSSVKTSFPTQNWIHNHLISLLKPYLYHMFRTFFWHAKKPHMKNWTNLLVRIIITCFFFNLKGRFPDLSSTWTSTEYT